MQLQPGLLLQSTTLLDNDFFSATTILLTEYNADGAVGFVVNRPFGRSLQELEEFKHSPAFPLYDGGPVDRGHLFFIHRRPDLVAGGSAVGNGVYTGGDFSAAVARIGEGSLTADDIKIFVGYCGWEQGDLEAEIAEGSWSMVAVSDGDVTIPFAI
jgi:putative transcriptional regulator